MKKKYVSPIFRICAGIISFMLLILYSTPAMRNIRQLPNTIYLPKGTEASIHTETSIINLLEMDYGQATTVSFRTDESLADIQGSATTATFRLLGVIPIKAVQVKEARSYTLIPGGTSVGVTMHTKGALVVGTSSVMCDDGLQTPAATAGLRAGDIILQANGIDIQNAEHLSQLCNIKTSSIALTVQRDGIVFPITIAPVLDISDQTYRLGIWVRDSTAGIGTLSFYDPQTNWYAALGHPVTDIDTRQNLSIENGNIVKSEILDIVQGEQGKPGELHGVFNPNDQTFGSIVINNDFGIYGELHSNYENALYPSGLPMAYPEEAHVGTAHILTTIDENGVQAFDCEILRVTQQNYAASKSMIIQITDQTLLATTGGIVQGMSGSPIIQDGKLIGVVTHVFVNDPTRGYCIYSLWMEETIWNSTT